MAHDNPELEFQFDDAMLGIYYAALDQIGYRATRFLRMVNRDGGLGAANALVWSDNLSDGFIRLWEEGRLDLSVEALVLREPWRCLFSDDELERARRRLEDMGYSA